MADLQKITQCRECGSDQLKWHCGQKNQSGVQDGLLRLHDVATEFFLGCDVCSETLRVVSGDQAAAWLNQFMQAALVKELEANLLVAVGYFASQQNKTDDDLRALHELQAACEAVIKLKQGK